MNPALTVGYAAFLAWLPFSIRKQPQKTLPRELLCTGLAALCLAYLFSLLLPIYCPRDVIRTPAALERRP
jgi:hypothetical protein